MHDASRDPVPVHRALWRLLLLAGFCATLSAAVRADAAGAPRELHGMADTFAAPGLALAWGVLRGANEATTTVVVRIATDPEKYGWMDVVGIDPFSKQEQSLRPAMASYGMSSTCASHAHGLRIFRGRRFVCMTPKRQFDRVRPR